MRPPVFINCRDRLRPMVELVAWLEQVGCEEIYFLDNDSAYEPLLEYYERTPHTVVRLGKNYGKWSLWAAPDVFELTRDRQFVFTDPDVVPVPACPHDALDRFAELLGRYRLPNKVGFGLRIDDLPAHYRHRDAVHTWERLMWLWPLEPGVYYAPIDTTFALYRAGGSHAREAVRTGPPYVARHDSWYLDLDHLDEEDRVYQDRAQDTTEWSAGMAHWNAAELTSGMLETVERLQRERPNRITLALNRLRWRYRGRRAVRRGIS